MFTGIITNLGKLIGKKDAQFIFSVDKEFCRKISLGTSIAINGVCLTVSTISSNQSFAIQVMPETLKKTTLGNLAIGNLVNLELPMTANAFFSGHIVQGHVDGIGTIQSIQSEGNSRIITIGIDQSMSKYMVNKGSVAVNGISLTIIESEKDFFTVGIIPYTWKHTMLHTIKKGDSVNIEEDVIAKYVEKLLRKETHT